MRKNQAIILSALIISLFLLSTCKLAYKAAKADGDTSAHNQTANPDTFKVSATVYTWFKNWSRDGKDTAFFQVGFNIKSATKGESLRVSSVKIEVKDYPADTNVYVLEKKGGVVRKRFHPPHTNYLLDTVVTDLKEGKSLDMADGNPFVFTYLFNKPGKRHFSRHMQVDVALRLLYNGQVVEATRVFRFNKRLSSSNFL